MLATLILAVAVLAAVALTYTLTRRPKRTGVNDEANEVFEPPPAGGHRRRAAAQLGRVAGGMR